MAEAAALGLAAQIALTLGINCLTFLSDSQQLVTFLWKRSHPSAALGYQTLHTELHKSVIKE
jgi:hypothetical protein